MDAFDDHPLGNEAAVDIVDQWNRLIVENLRSWQKSPRKIIECLVENGLSEPLYSGESYRNGQIIALAELFLNHGVPIPAELNEAATNALGDELHEKVLVEWKSPKKRKAALLELCGKLKITPKPKKPRRATVVQFDNADDLLKRMELWLKDKTLWSEEYPRFCQTLDSLIESQLGFDYDDSYDDATRQRMMTMTFYVARKLRLPPETILELTKRAYQFIWPGLTNGEWKDVSRKID